MQQYTSFDFMKIFNIKKGSWNKIKNNLGLDSYGNYSIENNKKKILYSQDAFNILSDYFHNKDKIKPLKNKNTSNEINSQLVLLAQQNNILIKTIEEYKKSKDEFKILFESEREKSVSYLLANKELEERNKHLQYEINSLKNRNIIKRIFNIF